MNKQSSILVIGKGLIGQRISELLIDYGYKNVTICTHADLELLNQGNVNEYFCKQLPEYVFFCAVKAITDFESGAVGDAEESYANIMMQCNIVEAAKNYGVKKMIMLGSAMLYPWNIPIENGCLQEKQLELFNLPGYRTSMQASVLGKLLGLKLCEYYNKQYGTNFVYCLPTHIYGGFKDRKNLYLLERLIIQICDAKATEVNELFLDIFGEGKAKKQFLHVDDCSDAIICIMEKYECHDYPAINVCGLEITSWESIVDYICSEVGYRGTIRFNVERQENMAIRSCSADQLKSLGWNQRIKMKKGITMLCKEYQRTKEEKDDRDEQY